MGVPFKGGVARAHVREDASPELLEALATVANLAYDKLESADPVDWELIDDILAEAEEETSEDAD